MRGFRRMLVLLPLGLLAASPSRVSDPVGVYGVIDRVVFEPDEANAERVQIRGVFSVAQVLTTDGVKLLTFGDFNAYYPAKRGYLYYAINPENEAATRAEWADMKAMAGTGRPVAFGSRWAPLRAAARTPDCSDMAAFCGSEAQLLAAERRVRVRDASQPPANPLVHPLGFGMTRNFGVHPGFWPVFEVMHVAAPVSPAEGDVVAAGSVQLEARNVASDSVQYVFEIERAGGDKETSERVEPGADGRTTWSPAMQLRSGETYTWRVSVLRVVPQPRQGDGYPVPQLVTFPPAGATFRVR